MNEHNRKITQIIKKQNFKLINIHKGRRGFIYDTCKSIEFKRLKVHEIKLERNINIQFIKINL